MADKLDQQLLLAYVEGELKPRDHAKVQALLQQDPKLARLIEQMIGDREALRSLSDPQPPEDLMEEVDRQLERDMLMAGMPGGPAEAVTPRQRHTLGAIFTSSAVAAMLAIVGGLIFFSISDLTPRQLASEVGLTDSASSDEPERPAVALTTRDEQARTPQAEGAASGDDQEPAVPQLTDAAAPSPPAVATSTRETTPIDDLEATAMVPPSVSRHLEPQHPDVETLVDESFERVAAASPTEQEQSAEADLSARQLTRDAANRFKASPSIISDAADAAEAMAAASQPQPRNLLGPEMGELQAAVDPGALDPTITPSFASDAPTQLPSAASALSRAAPTMNVQRDRVNALLPDADPDAESVETVATGGGPADADAFSSADRHGDTTLDVDPTEAHLRGLLNQTVSADEVELRIHADRPVARKHLEAFGTIADSGGDEEAGDAASRHLNIEVRLDQIEALLDALRDDEQVAKAELKRRHVLAAGQLPGRQRAQTTTRQLWPSLVPDYQGILKYRTPRAPEATLSLRVRILDPAPEADVDLPVDAQP